MLKNSSILITGGSGLLALNWACALRDRQQIILGLHHRHISLDGALAVRINLDSSDDLMQKIKFIQPQYVIHAAGLTSVEKCESNPILARELNVILAINVAKVCAVLKIPFTHISTDHLFSGNEAFAVENFPASPVNIYGITKAEAELRVLEENPEALVIRTNFFGWGTRYRQSFSDFIIRGLRAKKKLELFDDVFYSPILVEALAQATHDLMALNAKGIFNVVGSKRLSKFDFGLKLAKEFDLDVGLIKATQITRQSLLVKRPLDMSLSNKKAVGFLGRDFGTINDHLARLRQQEKNGMAMELEKL
jgi:dTDP-4-dehydrorhamnose reductase